MKYKTKQNLNFFIKSIGAGIVISLAGALSLTFDNKYIASIVFSIGIYLVMMFQFKLITGEIPKYKIKTFDNILELLIILFGNIIGTILIACILKFSAIYQNIKPICDNLLIAKESLLEAIFEGILCGIIIALIVLNSDHLSKSGEILKYIFALPLIMMFMLLGGEHCVADSFYMALSNNWNLSFLLCVIMGNFIGGFLIGKLKNIKI